jgi:hypothetical protein
MDCLTRKSMFTTTSTLLMTLSMTLTTTLSMTLFIMGAKMMKPFTPMHPDDNLNDVDDKFNDDESFKDIVDDLFA